MIRARARRLRASPESGVAAVEFAIVSIFMLIFVFGIITYGFIFAVDNSLTHVSAEAARAAVSKPTAQEQIDHAKISAYNRLPDYIRKKMDRDSNGTIDSPAELTATIAGCTNAPAQNCIHVHLAFPWGAYPIIHPMPGFGLVAPDLITADAFVETG